MKGRPAILTPLILQTVAAMQRATPMKIHTAIGGICTYRVVLSMTSRMVRDGLLFISGPRGFRHYFVSADAANLWAKDPMHSPEVCRQRRSEQQRASVKKRYYALKATQVLEPKPPKPPKPAKPPKPMTVCMPAITKRGTMPKAWAKTEARTDGAKYTICYCGKDTRYEVPPDFIGEFVRMGLGFYLDGVAV